MLPPELVTKLADCTKTDFIGARGIWFFRQSLSSLAVIIGLILEGPELWYEMLHVARTKITYFKYRIVITEGRVERAKVIALVGWIFIISGLLGELKAGSKIADLSASIQECSDAKVQAATLEAGDAAQSAKTARGEADAVEKEAATLMTELGEAQEKLRQLQVFALARHISNADALVEGLRPLKGKQVVLRSYLGDAEGWLLCVSLLDAVQKAQTNVTNQCGQWLFDFGKPVTGLNISGPDSDVVADAIVLKGRTTGGAVATGGPAPLVIFAGIRNPFWLPEQALASSPHQKSKGNNPRTIKRAAR